MTLLTFLTEWAIRSALVVAAAAVLLKAFRVQNPSVRLAAWMVALLGSCLIPLASGVLPALNVPLLRAFRPATPEIIAPSLPVANSTIASSPPVATAASASRPWNWATLAAGLYLLGAGALLLRLFTGLALSRRIIRRSIATGRSLPAGTPIHESAQLAAPATLGVRSPVVLLPSDWREWETAKLQAILAHEESHVRRHDPAVQLLSAIHRALLWYSPASWFLHSQLVRVAEEASDDAALAASDDRVTYAEVLLHFVKRAAGPVRWEGVAMARYGNADERIHRILDGTRISRGLSRFGWVATVALATPMVYLVAAVHPVAQSTSRRMATITTAFLPYEATPPREQSAAATSSTSSSRSVADSPDPQPRANRSRYLIVTGNSTSGMYDSRDRLPLDQWRSRFGANFVWFRQDGTEYIVTDQSVLDDLDNAMAPQRSVNLMQAEVNRQQGEVNRHQGDVNADQGRVNAQQGEVNRMQADVNEHQRQGRSDSSEQSQVNARQSEVNAQQQIVNREQEGVNQEQHVVNGEQSKVNAEQRRISPGVEDAIQAVLDSAVLKGLAHGIAR